MVDRAAGAALSSGYRAADALAEVLFRAEPPLEDVRSILLVKFWGIGNWALLRPIVRDLRARWPFAHVTILSLEANAPLLEDLADRVLLVRPTSLVRVAGGLVGALRALRAHPPDLSIDFEQFSTAGALIARAARIPQRIGFSSGGGGRARDALLTVRVPFRRDAHAARSFRDLAEAAGVAPGPYVPGHLAATAAGRAEADALLSSGPAASTEAPLVVVHPGSGDNFPGRRWSEAGFAAVARHALERHGARVVVTGGAAEAPLCLRVAAAAGPRAVSAAGRLSLPGLVALLERSAALVSNDTGPVHLASALGRPVLALFGPNTPVLYGPLSPGSRAFFRGLPCSPCLTVESYRTSRCRLPTCMASLSTGEVSLALSAVLDGRRARERAAGEAPWAVA